MTGPVGSETGITAVVLARDEARNIVPCLRTLLWCDSQLVVVDMRTSDETADLARELGARVLVREWETFTTQRNFALGRVQTPWVLFVDADERVTLGLANEARGAVNAATAAGQPSGFWVPRQNLILGHWVRGAGWDPDYQLRLFRVDSGTYDLARDVHELVRLKGGEAYLRARLVHHNYDSWRQFWWKQVRYVRSEASQLHAAGTRAKPHSVLVQPLRELRRRYVTLSGYRSGLIGLQLSAILAIADGIKYAALLSLSRDRASAR